MAEWYRVGGCFQELIDETLDFIRLFVGDLPAESLSYRQALLQFTEIDYTKTSASDLISWLSRKEIQTDEKAKTTC